MRKRVAFRTLVILLASALLLTSTGAYNILVFADQNMELSSLSATDEGVASAPSISTYGGEFLAEDPEIGEIELAVQSVVTWVGDGTSQSPYQISDVDHLLDAYYKINNSSDSNKYFILTTNIDISGLSISDFHDSALSSAAYLFSAEGSNSSSVYFKLDGNGFRIHSNSSSLIDASAYQYFALFGFMNANCEIRNLTIENVHVNLMNARAASIVAFKNLGTIQDVTVKGCSVTVTGSTANIDQNSQNEAFSYLDNNSNTGNDIYPGFAAVVADNRNVVRETAVENFKLSVNNGSYYLGGLVGQNRGTIGGVPVNDVYSVGCVVNGLKIIATAANAYVGGVCAFNDSGSTVRNASVDLPGHYVNPQDANETLSYGANIYGGRYAGGLVGLNNGSVINSLVEGSFGTVSTPDAEAYDMCGVVRSDDVNAASYVPYYYGGAVAGGSGTVTNVTVQNLGFYMSLVSTDQPCCFGGVIATAQAASSVVGCVSTGSFVSSDYNPVCYAGGVIAYAPSDAANAMLSNCYTLFRLQNKAHYLTGAVIGFGGTESAAANCYWSSEISGCATAYAIPNPNDTSIIEKLSDRSRDMSATDTNSNMLRATVSRRNVTLSDLDEPTHTWGGGASFSHTQESKIPGSHLVQGVVNSLDAVPYQQTLTLPNGVGYSGRASLTVDFKLDVFITASDDVGNPNSAANPLQISSSGMIRFLYLAPYANYVLTQDVTIDDTEWFPVAFTGRLSGTYDGVSHTIYAPCRVFSAVVGQRSAGVAVDTETYTTTPGSVAVDGGLVEQLGVTLTPDYFILDSDVYNTSIFGSLFGATMRSVSLSNDTSDCVKLTGSRQGVFADAAYHNTYVYGCSMNSFVYAPNLSDSSLTVDSSVKCFGNGTDMGAFIGYLDSSANVIDNCVVDADVTLATGSSAANVAAFIGSISTVLNEVTDQYETDSYVLNSVVVTTVPSGVASVFGAAPAGSTVEARRFHNIYWSRNSYSDTSAPIGDSRTSFDGLILWGSTNEQTLGQYYNCEHTLNSGDAVVELALPQNVAKISIANAAEAESEFAITRLDNGDLVNDYNEPTRRLVANSLVLNFTSTDNARNGGVDVFKVTHQKTGLCAYIQVTALAAGALVQDEDGFYMIMSAADLKNLSDGICKDGSGADDNYKLYANIDMSYYDGTTSSRFFNSIGTTAYPFTGSFVGGTDEHGNPFTISNVTVKAENNTDQDSNGLFGVIDATTPPENRCGIEGFNVSNITVIGGDSVGALIGTVFSYIDEEDESVDYSVPVFPVKDISVTDAVVTGGDRIDLTKGRRVGGLIGEIKSDSVDISGVSLENAEVTTFFYDAFYANQVAGFDGTADHGYFTADYFLDPMGIGGVVGCIYSKQTYRFPTEVNITDTHVNNIYVAGKSYSDENEAQYVTMDAGGIVGSALNSFSYDDDEEVVTTLTIGDQSGSDGDVSVTDSQILSFGNTGGIIGASDVTTVLWNCVVSGSDDDESPERSEMRVFSRSLYYLGGIAGYIGVSTYCISSGDYMSSNVVYASINNCQVENAYVASTETSYMGVGIAPMRNVSVGGIIGGGNGQGYSGQYMDLASEVDDLLPFVSGCTVSHSRVEGIVTGGIVGADAEVQYTSDGDVDDDPNEYLLNSRDFITGCLITDSTITTVSDATRVAGDCPDAGSEAVLINTDRFVLSSGVGGIMGTNVRFHYDSLRPDYNKGYDGSLLTYAYLHETTIQYCTIDSSTTVESRLPFTEATSMITDAVGGVIGTAFANRTENDYGYVGMCVLRYNEVGAIIYNAANLSGSQDFDQDPYIETEVKVGTGGFIGAVKGGTNQYESAWSNSGSMYNAICNISCIHVYTSVFSGSLSGMRALGGAIGVVSFASDGDYSTGASAAWEAVDDVPGQMLYNLALAGSISLSGSAESYLDPDNNIDKCCGGYVIGHISAGESEAYAFNTFMVNIDRWENVFTLYPDSVFSDITYTSFGCDSYLAPFGFLNGDVDDNNYPRIDGISGFEDCYRDVNLDEYGDPLFEDMDAQGNHYSEEYTIGITEYSGDSFVIKEDDTPEYNWRGSDNSVALVTNRMVSPNAQYPDGAKAVVVRGVQFGTVLVSIPFVGYLDDGTGSGEWGADGGKEVYIPCGFRYESPTQSKLTVAKERSSSNGAYTGVEYRLIQTPYDMRIIGYDISDQPDGVTPNKQLTAAAMGAKYALYNEEGVIEFTSEMFAADGSFPGGLTPIGTSNHPFTGSFETLPEGYYDFERSSVIYTGGVPSLQSTTETNVHVAYSYEKMTIRDVKGQASGGVGASLFGLVSGATFANFAIDGMTLTGDTNGNYLGAIASKAFAPAAANTAPITISGVELNHFDFSEADYIGGLVGGIFANQLDYTANTTAAVIEDCIIGSSNTDSIRANHYTSKIDANLGAGGLLAHSSQYATNISNCVVRDVAIKQESVSAPDRANLDNGAAGVVMAYAGTMNTVTVEHCALIGEIVGGAVMRSYTSSDPYDFASAGSYGYYTVDNNFSGASVINCPSASSVVLNGVIITDSALTGSVDTDVSGDFIGAPYSASGGILARVDANTPNHTVINCVVDDKTTIVAVDGVGGIVGCLENPTRQDGSDEINRNMARAQIGVTVTDCTMDADLSRTTYAEVTDVFNRGIGGVIGVFNRFSPLIFTHISGCKVGGTIHAEATAGGVIGSILAPRRTDHGFNQTGIDSYLDLSNMASGTHFVSNCLVTTEFVMKDEHDAVVSTFNQRTCGVGIVLGYSLLDTDNYLPILLTTGANDYADNEPFFHVMFSSAVYILNYEAPGYVALFGFDDARSSVRPCLNANANATAYCYDLNRAATNSDDSSHFTISSQGYLEPAETSRINASETNSSGVLELFSTSFNQSNANTVILGWGENAPGTNELLVNKSTTGESYTINNTALPSALTVSSNNDSVTKNHELTLASVEVANAESLFDVQYPASIKDSETGVITQNPNAFSLSLKQGMNLNDKLTLHVIFVYENGLKLSMDIFINVRAREYWRLDPSVSGLDYTYYLVFNAADLAALQSNLSTQTDSRADARIIQCYDVFWTVYDSAVIEAAKEALKDADNNPLTIEDVLRYDADGNDQLYDGFDTGDNDYFRLADHLGNFVRPNPAYLVDDSEPEEITFKEYFSVDRDPENGYIDGYGDMEDYDWGKDDWLSVPMAEVVGDISSTDYGVYGEAGKATVINPYEYDSVTGAIEYVPFHGRYISLQNAITVYDYATYEDLYVSTGATEYGERYSIYGLDLRCENTVANTGDDAPYAGLIAQIGGDAILDGLRFINPHISVINSYSTPCSAGVLAGAVSYTYDDFSQYGFGAPSISNITITGTGDGHSFVKAIKRVNRASTSAGGLAGEINGSAEVSNISVSGIDVVSSYTANAQGISEETSILVGGIAGKAVATENMAPTTYYNVDVADCYILGGHIANPVGNIKSYGGGLFGVMNANVEYDSNDVDILLVPDVNYPESDPTEVDVLRQSEVGRTIVGGSFINSGFGYDRNSQNNTALDIAGGVAGESRGECSVSYVNVYDSAIVGGDISGGIVGQIGSKAASINDTTSLSVVCSGVGMRNIYDPYDLLAPLSGETVDPAGTAVTDVSVLVVGMSGTTNRFNTAGGVVGNVLDLDNLFIGSISNGQDGVDFKGIVGTYGYDNHNREATAGGMIGSLSGLTLQEYAAAGYNGPDDYTGAYTNYDGYLNHYLDKIQIYGSTVQGEVNGFNREAVTNMKCAGSAGGVIGKIACAARKSDLSSGNLMISDCIMSAKVNLYSSVYGVAVDCTDNQRNRHRNTNAGKLIGRLADGAIVDNNCDPVDVAEDVWQTICGYFERYSSLEYVERTNGIPHDRSTTNIDEAFYYAMRGLLKVPASNNFLIDQYCAINDYIQYVYGSSYPQDIVLYGNRNLCAVDFEISADVWNLMQDIAIPYFDCNKVNRYVADTEVDDGVFGVENTSLPMQVQSFTVSEGGPNSGDLALNDTPYYDQQFTENAFIPLDESNLSTEHYKYFRFYNPAGDHSPISKRKLTFRSGEVGVYDAVGEPVAGVTATAELEPYSTMYDEVNEYEYDGSGYSSTGEIYGYTYSIGVMTIDIPQAREMIGSLVLNFEYGIQMNSSFTSIEIMGDGSETTPYLVEQPKHFFVMRALRSNGDYFVQMNNIDLNDPNETNDLNRYTSVDGFDPIGSMASPFVGSFDGNGYVIKNLYINDEAASAAGLFGCVGKSSNLSNIHVEVAGRLVIRDLNDERTTVNGGIIGGNNTGGLVGIIKTSGSSTTTVTNCSVANGNVIGGMNVGGLIGAAAGSVQINNCFTSTTTASYAGISNVGALLGSVVSGSAGLDGCYTAGFAVAGSTNPVNAAVGGLVGRNSDTCTLTMDDCFVSATASGNTASEIGLTVAANDGTVSASGNTVAVLIPSEDSGKTLRVIAPDVSGADNYYEREMLGLINDGTAPIAYSGSSTYADRITYDDSIPSYDDDVYFVAVYSGNTFTGISNEGGKDVYSAAYRQLIAAAVKVDQSEQAFSGHTEINHVQTEDIISNKGLLYPLTMTFTDSGSGQSGEGQPDSGSSVDTYFTTSVYDLSDTVEYPMGVDLNLTGNGSNKNTDLLFRTATATVTDDSSSTTTKTVTIYRNIFRSSNDPVAVKYDGETYDNGEIYYDYNLPYAVANQTITIGDDNVPITISRKIMYPVVDIRSYGTNGATRIYPIATARQLKALTSTSEGVAGSKFAFLRANSSELGKLDYQVRDLLLVADIDMGSTVFTPLGTLSMHFFGNGRVISNMQIDVQSGNAAMFDSVKSGGVHDLGLMGVNVTNRGSAAAAMLAGEISGATINNCFAIGSVKATAMVEGGFPIGGLVAYAANNNGSNSTISNCIVSGNVTAYAGQGYDSSSAAGLLGRSNETVNVSNVTVTTNLKANKTYGVCGPQSGGVVTVTNAVYGGQMANTFGGSGDAAKQTLSSGTVSKLYADDGLGLLVTGDAMTAVSELTAPGFITPAHFDDGGMTSFSDGYYPVPATIDNVTQEAFKAGIRFAAAAIKLEYIGSTDVVSSVSAIDTLGEYGTARLLPDDSLGAYFVTVDDAGNRLAINPDSMRITKPAPSGNGFISADGASGTVRYSMTSPVSNNYLVRTVNNVKVQKTFTLCYKLVGAETGDKAIITVENVLKDDEGNDVRMSATGLTAAVTGDICENFMLLADSNYNYNLWAGAQIGSGQKVGSVRVCPAYLDDGEIVSNINPTLDANDPTKSSFSGTDSTIGNAENAGTRYNYLLVTVNVSDTAWGLQRTQGSWLADPAA